MAYDDMFASRRTFTNETDSQQPAVTPQPAVPANEPANEPTADSEPAAPLLFEGFASHHPLLIERPSRYTARLNGAARALFHTPDNKPESRVLYSPIVALPFFTFHGDETFSDSTIQYPLLHTPTNHPYNGTISTDLYALTLIVALTTGGILYEPTVEQINDLNLEDGDLLAYETGDDYQIPDDLWDASLGWAQDNMNAIAALNMARLAAFSSSDPGEQQLARTLLSGWGIEDDLTTVASWGQDAASFLSVGYDAITQKPFEPFSE